MCDPVTASLMVASAASTYAGNRRSQKKMDAAAAAEMFRQKRFADDSKMTLGKSVSNRNFQSTADSIENTRAMLEADYNASVEKGKESFGVGSDPMTGTSTENSNVTDAYSRESGRADAESKRNAALNARLNAFGDVMNQQAITNSRYAQDQAVLANLSRGSLGVLPMELQAASHAGDNLKLMGQVLSLASMYTGTMSAMGKGYGPSWGELFGSGAGTEAANVAVQSAQPTMIGPPKPTPFTGYTSAAGTNVGMLPNRAVLPMKINPAFTNVRLPIR